MKASRIFRPLPKGTPAISSPSSIRVRAYFCTLPWWVASFASSMSVVSLRSSLTNFVTSPARSLTALMFVALTTS